MQFVTVEEKHLKLILKWRTSEFVTRYMYTDIENNMEEQKKWFQSIQNDSNSCYWILVYKNQPIGLVSLTNINLRDKRAYWNFYIGEQEYSMLGGFIGPYMYNYAFENLGMNKLMGEVMEENGGIRKIHLKQGAREVGYLTEHIYKYGKYHNVYIFEMTKKMWTDFGKRYVKYIPEVI